MFNVNKSVTPGTPPITETKTDSMLTGIYTPVIPELRLTAVSIPAPITILINARLNGRSFFQKNAGQQTQKIFRQKYLPFPTKAYQQLRFTELILFSIKTYRRAFFSASKSFLILRRTALHSDGIR